MAHFSIFRVFRDDLVTRTYMGVFLLSSILFLFAFAMLRFSVDPLTMPLRYRVPFTVIGMLAAYGSVLIWLGMWSYWARFDCANRRIKGVWLLVLLFGFFFGSVLYFFFVYIPQVTQQMKAKQ